MAVPEKETKLCPEAQMAMIVVYILAVVMLFMLGPIGEALTGDKHIFSETFWISGVLLVGLVLLLRWGNKPEN